MDVTLTRDIIRVTGMESAPLGALDDLEKGCGIFSTKMDECGLI